MLPTGKMLEMAFLTQARRDYEELEPAPADLELDQHYGTDVVLNNVGGRQIPLGLTQREDIPKLFRDKAKAKRRFSFWVSVVIPEQENEELAIDAALDWLANDLPSRIGKKERAFYVIVARDGKITETKLFNG